MEEQPITWNTHAHRGNHILLTEATVTETQKIPQLYFKTSDDHHIGRNM
jgi:hypothetical protein